MITSGRELCPGRRTLIECGPLRLPPTRRSPARHRAAFATRAAQPPRRTAAAMASMEARQAELDRLANGYKSSKFPTCPEVGPRELWDRMQRGEADFVVVDARRPEEQEVSMLPGSVTQEEFEADREAHRGKTVFCYCTVGYRSGIFADKLRQEGLEGVNLRGSIMAWTLEGLPLVRRSEGAEAETKQVHTFGKQWAGLHGEGYEPVYFQHPVIKGIGQFLGGLW
mmetsp:Transcript_20681/g.52118  ORF Transcript_20681/g.52118 Transcript_20681/m.52118 type:complete len:225 (+) Transcript_20681:104-778(+)